MSKDSYIRFDWATKRLLRQKSNFGILEGLLSTLLNDNIKIDRLLESESNKKDSDDKFNRVDMLAEIGDLYPEYYILRVDEFDGQALTPFIR